MGASCGEGLAAEREDEASEEGGHRDYVLNISRLRAEPTAICARPGSSRIQELPDLAIDLGVPRLLIATPIPFPELTTPPIGRQNTFLEAIPSHKLPSGVVRGSLG
jgi:hypothetical protein